MEIRIIHRFKCDGGVNPPHHHRSNVEIIVDGGVYTVWESATNNDFDNFHDAMEYLEGRYDSIIAVCRQVIETETFEKILK